MKLISGSIIIGTAIGGPITRVIYGTPPISGTRQDMGIAAITFSVMIAIGIYLLIAGAIDYAKKK